ncbi:MAG TPA: class II aldolase/adducin family protein [Pseudonocardiaceae bacterium]|jgi:ribulose-5-phosphate 4-epimerase/fuculose-1-phosphate aldolase|nr:class II aldolase/adducin family protein [Pseudonocardiaceae bacterium]
MILRNHGLLALGASVPAAFTARWTLQRACEIQLAAQQSGQSLRPVTEKAALQSSREALQFIGGVEAGRKVFNALWRALDRDEPDYRR